jgi:hypothetical protein
MAARLAFAEPQPPASQTEPANEKATTPSTSDEKQPIQDQQNTQSNQPLDLNAQPSADQESKQATSARRSSRGNQQGASLGVNITPAGDGLVITRVSRGTPADRMGLRSGDRITLVNGQPTGSVDGFIATIRSMNPGDQVDLQIVRNGNEESFNGQLEAFGQAVARSPAVSSNDEYQIYRSVIGGQDPYQPNARISRDGQRSADPNATRQASYEDRGQPTPPQSGDVDARLRRIEEQIDRLTRNVEELRNLVGTPSASSGLREAASEELRTNGPRTQSRTNATTPQQDANAIKRNDRWNTENRFEQADLPGARERATQEAARRRAQQTGSQLQQQERQRAANAQRSSQPNSNAEVPPVPTDQPQPSTEQPK